MSADGRFLVFASDAGNLLAISNTCASSKHFNIYLRDRAIGQTSLLTSNEAGDGCGNGDSMPLEISADGRFVLFESDANNLLPGDTNETGDIFLKDIISGITRIVSANTNGIPGNGRSRSATMTPDGRYVAFVSDATDLAANDTNGLPDIFVRDMVNAVTVCASASATGAIGASSEDPILSADGRYVVFSSTAADLANGGNAFGDVYVHDLIAGTTTLATSAAKSGAVSLLGGGTNSVSCYNPVLSADGDYVAFEMRLASWSLVARENLTTSAADIVGYDKVDYYDNPPDRPLDMTPDGRFVVYCANTGTNTFVWSADSNYTTIIGTNPLPSRSVFEAPRVDPSGRYVMFLSTATNLVTNVISAHENLFIWDSQTGAFRLVNAGSNGAGSALNSLYPAVWNTNASVVAFESQDGTLVPGDQNHAYDVFLHDLSSGTNDLVSANDSSAPSSAGNGISTVGSLSLSSNGQFIAFLSRADDLIPNDANPGGFLRVFLRDMAAGTNLLLSVIPYTESSDPAISGNGRYVAFAADGTNQHDLWLEDRNQGTTTLVSASMTGSVHTNGAGSSGQAVVSDDGRYVLFHSTATDLATGVTAGGDNLFLRDTMAGTTIALTTNNTTLPAYPALGDMTRDGRFVACAVSNIFPTFSVYDVLNANWIYQGTASNPAALALSPDGAKIALIATNNLLVIGLAASNAFAAATGPFPNHEGLRFSADARYLVYSSLASLSQSDTNQTADVYLFDTVLETNVLISANFRDGFAANGSSDWPDISGDGRLVIYRSDADDLMPEGTKLAPGVYLYDRVSRTTTLLTGTSPTIPDGRSFSPVFSADGQSFAFGSWADNLARADINARSDVFCVSMHAPGLVDTDADGMDDNWELQYFGSTDRDGSGDYDEDGMSDLDEFRAGTDPSDSGSLLHIDLSWSEGGANGSSLCWPAVPGLNYQLQYKDDLSDSVWKDFSGNLAVIGSKGYAFDPAPSGRQRFYRVVVAAP